FAAPLLAFDHKFLIGFRQFLERNIDVDLFASAGAEQILLRITKFLAAKDADHSLFDRQRAVRNRFVQIDRDRASEAATFGTGAQRIVKTKKTGRRWPNIEIAMRAMPAGGEGQFVRSER